ncbi:leucine-rich repeat protein [Prevotella lacticifex]|uniref:leucine-rich repeat protein n=1 Tax=Prevotella lacticifex TaxID=2854755 RepID=UPI001CC59408|nr:leucine-rich repeat protein [Prevotella lacticifex]
MPDNTDLTSYAYSSEYSVEVYQTLKKISDTETVCQLNIVKPGGLAALKDAPYTSENIEKAYCFDIYGTANKADYDAMNSIDNPRLNLSQMKFDATDSRLDEFSEKLAALDQINNQHIKYLALPDAGDEVRDPLFNTLRTNMKDNLIGVAYYCKAKKSYTCYTSKEGDVHILTEMTENVTKVDGQGNPNLDIDSLKISGNVNAKDISRNAHPDSGVYYDENGHFSFTNEYHETDHDGYREMVKTDNGNYDGVAFAGSNGVIKLDLKDANFKVNDDLTLSKTGLVGDKTKKVVIPTSVENLPADFMHVNNNVLEEICIPRNIKKIGYRAFYGINTLNHVTTTNEKGDVIDKGFGKKTELKDFKDAKGNILYQDQVVTDDIDSTAGSVVFSENLTEIDSWAFASMYKVKDVYNLATTAPICQVNAFGSLPCTGNNGYSPNGGITRADYSNNGAWIAMLHYPKSIQGTDEEKRYTDVTRDYTISDADGNTDAQGNLLHWPSQDEFLRSYQQATNGYLWNAWEAKRTKWTAYGTYPLDGTNFEKGYGMPQGDCNDLYYKNSNNENKKKAIFYHTSTKTNSDGSIDFSGDVDKGAWQNTTYSGTKEPLYNGDYRGWHQFVLASSYDYESETPSHNFSYINDNGWWTICVPFDMTKKEVRDMFAYRQKEGTYGNPHVCEFTGVLRDDEYTGNPNPDLKGKIVLKFDRDVYNNKYDKDGKPVDGTVDDEDVVIKAGVPYLLQPDFKVESNGNLYYYPAQQVLKSNKCGALSSSKLMELAKNNVKEVTAVNSQKTTLENYKYTFVGSFWLTEMPQYAYFLAWYQDGTNGYATFYWQQDQPKQTLNWNPYTAIIGCNWSVDDRKFYIPSEDFGNVHWFTRQGNAENGLSVFDDDSFDTSKGAKGNSPANISIEAAGNTTDGITKVHFGDRTIEIFHGKVYNLNGQYVGDSLEGLPKGIYIAAGKKYVVK